MADDKKTLNKGLDALLGQSNQAQRTVKEISIEKIKAGRFQPRSNFNDDKLNELSESIKQNGLIQPIAVRHDKADPGKFEIVAGERRWMAAQKAGLHEVPIVLLDLNDNQALEVAIVENIQRDDLNPIEEARGYKRLSDEFKYDHESISKLMSKSRSHVSNTLRLLTLPDDVVGLLEEGKLTAGQARPLIGIPNASEIAENIVKKKVAAREVESLAQRSKGSRKTTNVEDPNITFVKNEIESRLGLNVEIQNKKNMIWQLLSKKL